MSEPSPVILARHMDSGMPLHKAMLQGDFQAAFYQEQREHWDELAKRRPFLEQLRKAARAP